MLFAPSRLSKIKSHFFSQNQLLPQSNSQTGKLRSILEPLTIFPAKYLLIGITGLRSTNLELLSVAVSLELGNLDFVQYETRTKIDIININMLTIGFDMMMACINCPDSFVHATEHETNCVKRDECGSDEINVVDREGVYYSCRKCLAESVVVLKGN